MTVENLLRRNNWLSLDHFPRMAVVVIEEDWIREQGDRPMLASYASSLLEEAARLKHPMRLLVEVGEAVMALFAKIQSRLAPD